MAVIELAELPPAGALVGLDLGEKTIGVAAFAVNVLTGSMFFVSAPDQYMFNPAFRLKAACLAIAGLNVAVFYSAFARSLGDGAEASRPVKVIAAVSLAAWIGVIVFGRLITYFRPPYHWSFFG